MFSTFTCPGSIWATPLSSGPPISNLGTSWTQITTSALGYGTNATYTQNYMHSMCCDASGQYIALCDQNESKMWVSANSGSTWTTLTSAVLPTLGTKGPCSVCCDITGQRMYVAMGNGSMYYNTAYGSGSWTSMGGSLVARCIDCSDDGSVIVAQCGTSGLQRSSDYGATWTKLGVADTVGTKCFVVSCDSTGNKIATYCTSNTGAASGQYGVWRSLDGGSSFTNIYQAMAIDLKGIFLLDSGNPVVATYLGASGILIYNGTSWIASIPATTAYTGVSPIVYGFGCSRDGQTIVAGNVYTGTYSYLFYTVDGGNTWTKASSMGTSTWQNVCVSRSGKQWFVSGGNAKTDLYVSR